MTSLTHLPCCGLALSAQAGARTCQLEREAEELRSQAAHAAALERQNRELAARLLAAEAASAQARTAESSARQAAEAAGRRLEAQASQRETELSNSLKRANQDMQGVETRCDAAHKQLATVQQELAVVEGDFEVQRRQKHAAEVAALVALSMVVLGGAAAVAVCRGN